MSDIIIENKIIDGREIAKNIRATLTENWQNYAKTHEITIPPCVACIIAGKNPSSESYINMLQKSVDSIGANLKLVRVSESISNEEFLEEIKKLNKNIHVHGILVQKPLPPQIIEHSVIRAIDPHKDIDGFTPENTAGILLSQEGHRPCTAQAVVKILESIHYELVGKHVVIVGRSNVVGKPLSMMLLEKNATVTITHSKTKDLSRHTKMADVVVMAVGRPKMLKSDMVSEGVVVIDVGTTELEGKIVGDVDFEEVSKKASLITPVPGGVGPVTNAMLLTELIKNYTK